MTVLRADAGRLPLRDASVDLIVTSPPYFAQRSYRDGGEHYDGQLGSEPTPQEFLEALWAVTAECWRVLKPTGSMWVNLGDKRSGSSAPGTTSGLGGAPQGARTGMTEAPRRRDAPHRYREQGEIGERTTKCYTQAAFGRPKSKQLLPHRYAIGCEDGAADPEGIGWIVRQDQVWSKPNGLPESVRDRTRDTHEYWFHLCKEGRYFAAVDEIREPHASSTVDRAARPNGPVEYSAPGQPPRCNQRDQMNRLGKVPSSVWSIATEPLVVPEHLGVDHFAAFPSEWPRRLILGWSPSSICTACYAPRRPLIDTEHEVLRVTNSDKPHRGGDPTRTNGVNADGYPVTRSTTTITGYACACPDTTAPTRPAIVLDPFGGTGTTAMVARALGRTGISVDLSADYCRLARWRIHESAGASEVRTRTNREAQGMLL